MCTTHSKATKVHMRQTQALRSTQASLQENLKWAENLQDPDYRWRAEMRKYNNLCSQTSSPERPDDEGAAGGSGGGGASSEIEGSVTCLVCRCTTLWYICFSVLSWHRKSITDIQMGSHNKIQLIIAQTLNKSTQMSIFSEQHFPIATRYTTIWTMCTAGRWSRWT